MNKDSLFESKYDNEFIGLLNEIGLRIQKFSKCDTLKIKSWINVLMMTCNSNEEKKNRNLYAILLINQMLNGKLEEPFIKFVNSKDDLTILSPGNVKSELSKKFYEEIDFQKIEDFGYMKQKEFLQNHPDVAEQIQMQNTEQNFQNYDLIDSSNDNKNFNYQINKITPNIIKKNKSQKKFNKNISGKNNNNNYSFVNSGANNKKIYIHLNDNSIDDNFYSQKATFPKPYTTYDDRDFGRLAELDVNKLKCIIEELNKKINERDNIISYQQDQIDKLKEIMVSLEKKFK